MGTIDTLIRVRADTKQAVSGFKPLQSTLTETAKAAQSTDKALDDLGTGTHKISVDDTALANARAEITRLRNQMREDLALDVNADTRAAQTRISQLQRTVRVLDSEVVDIPVVVETAQAEGRLAGIAAGIGSIKGVAATVAGLAVGKFLFEGATGASNFETNMRAVNTVLGETVAIDVETWISDSAGALNLSNVAASDLARSLSIAAKGYQDAGGDAGDFLTSLERVTAEAAAFNNVDPGRVAEALGGAFRGEFDSLQTFGINLNAARVEAQALKDGLIQTGQAMTPAIQTQATYNAILEESAIQMGSVERNADTLGGTLNDLRQVGADLGSTLGETFGPSLTAIADLAIIVAGAVNTVLGAFNQLPGPIKTVALTFGAVLIAQRLLSGSFTVLRAQLLGLRVDMISTAGAAAAFRAGMAGVMSVINPWTLGITAVLTGLTLFIGKSKEGTAAAKEFAAGIDAGTGALNTQGQALLVDKLADYIDEMKLVGITSADVAEAMTDPAKFKALIDTLGDVKDAHTAVTAAGTGRGGMTISQTFDDEGKAAETLIRELGPLNDEYSAGLKVAKDTMDAQAGVASVFGDTATAVDVTEVSMKRLQDRVKTTNDEFDDLIANFSVIDEKMVSARDSVYAYEGAIDDLAASVKENGPTFVADTEEGRKNWEALGSAAEDANTRVTEVFKNRGADAAMRTFKALRQEMIDTLIAGGTLPAKAVALVDQQFKAPISIQIQLDKGSIAKYNADLTKLRNQRRKVLDELQGKIDEGGLSARGIEGLTDRAAKEIKPINADIHAAVSGKKDALADLDEITQPDDPRIAGIKPLVDPPSLTLAEGQLDALTADRWINLYVNPPSLGSSSGGDLEGLLTGPLGPTPSGTRSPTNVEGSAGRPAAPRRDKVDVSVYMDGRLIDKVPGRVNRRSGRRRP